MADRKKVQWRVRSFESLRSTQTVANELAEAGAPEGTVVVARRQTAGRGRHGRGWVSPEGGLYMSFLLRPPSSSARIQALTMVTALAVARGVEATTSLKPMIRWPNDIVIDGNKVSGVVAQSSYNGRTLSFVSVGIGVNCNSGIRLDKASGNTATSLAEELGEKVNISSLQRSILDAFGNAYADWLDGTDVTKTARSKIGTLGRRVTIKTTSGKIMNGIAEDVEPEGGLVFGIGGRKMTVHAEDVELLSES